MATALESLRSALCDVEGLTPAAAIELQQRARTAVTFGPLRAPPRTIAGVDVSVRGDLAAAAIAVLSFPDLQPLAATTARRSPRFPYVPGLLAFREVPVVLDAFTRLRIQPDLLLVDGHGYAHPRRFGIACHLGVALGIASIGIGKTRLIGTHREPALRRGASVRLVDRGEVIGRVLRTRSGVRPVFVSVGHGVDLVGATRLALRCARRYRLPEPIRAAHAAAGRASALPRGLDSSG